MIWIPEKDSSSPGFSLNPIETSHAVKEQEFQDSIVKILTNEKKKKSELFLFSKREEIIMKLQKGSCSYLTEETTRNIVNNSYKRVFPESFRPTTAGQGLKSQAENIPLLILPPPETSALSLNRTSGTEDALLFSKRDEIIKKLQKGSLLTEEEYEEYRQQLLQEKAL